MIEKIDVGIVGIGAIGSVVARYLVEGRFERLRLQGVCDKDLDKVKRWKKENKCAVEIKNKIEDLIKEVDLVVESAATPVVGDVVDLCIKYKKDVIVLSVGGLLPIMDRFAEAEKRGISIFVPSGAICGIDGIKAAAIAGIDRITLTTYKPPAGLKGVKFLEDKGIDLDGITSSVEVFYGDVFSAVKSFPKNINVAATISLACGQMEKVFVRIVADPSLKRNVHEVVVEGRHGRFVTRMENVPSPDNPKTSYLAVLSALKVLDDYRKPGLRTA